VAKKKQAAKAADDSAELGGYGFPRWMALAAAATILLVAVIALFYSARLWGATPYIPPGGDGTGPITTHTPMRTYQPSALIDEYGVGETPTLVFNCKWVRVGTWAQQEQRNAVPPETERADIINALCGTSDDSPFCGMVTRSTYTGAVRETAHDECRTDSGGIQVYAFYGPACPASDAQREVLDLMAVEFPDQMEVKAICVPLREGEEDLCRAYIQAGDYDE